MYSEYNGRSGKLSDGRYHDDPRAQTAICGSEQVWSATRELFFVFFFETEYILIIVLQEQCLNKLTNREEMMKIKKANEYKLYSAEFKVTLLEMLLGTAGSLYLWFVRDLIFILWFLFFCYLLHIVQFFKLPGNAIT